MTVTPSGVPWASNHFVHRPWRVNMGVALLLFSFFFFKTPFSSWLKGTPTPIPPFLGSPYCGKPHIYCHLQCYSSTSNDIAHTHQNTIWIWGLWFTHGATVNIDRAHSRELGLGLGCPGAAKANHPDHPIFTEMPFSLPPSRRPAVSPSLLSSPSLFS